MHPARKLVELLPEFAERYPLESVLDPWLDALRVKVRRGEDVSRELQLIETLARDGDARVRQALSVSVFEAADWNALGVVLGPATEALR